MCIYNRLNLAVFGDLALVQPARAAATYPHWGTKAA
jgi:hypothetical protein